MKSLYMLAKHENRLAQFRVRAGREDREYAANKWDVFFSLDAGFRPILNSTW